MKHNRIAINILELLNNTVVFFRRNIATKFREENNLLKKIMRFNKKQKYHLCLIYFDLFWFKLIFCDVFPYSAMNNWLRPSKICSINIIHLLILY